MKHEDGAKTYGLYEVRSRGLRIPHILDAIIDNLWDRCDNQLHQQTKYENVFKSAYKIIEHIIQVWDSK